MKIGTITYHFPYNSGAMLQCVALQTVIEKLGHEVCVINYRPWYHQNRYTPHKNLACVVKSARAEAKEKRLPLCRRWYTVGRTLGKAIAFNAVRSKYVIPSEEKFSAFVKRHIHETRVFRTVKELEQSGLELDAIFSGSDQLWNTQMTEGNFDPAYFMTFAPAGCRCVTYAVGANFAEDVYTVEQLKKLAGHLDTISLREEKYMRVVRRAVPHVPLRQDLDPTLLLEAGEYAPFEAPESCLLHREYILTYTMGDKSQGKVYALAKKLGEETGLPVIDITGNPSRGEAVFGVHSVKAGPDEFLTYVKNAAYVVTNSFHGTAFSVIYRKRFVVVPHTKTGNRVTDLLARVGLSDRWSGDPARCEEIIHCEPDFSATERLLPPLRNESVDFIARVCDPDRRGATMEG